MTLFPLPHYFISFFRSTQYQGDFVIRAFKYPPPPTFFYWHNRVCNRGRPLDPLLIRQLTYAQDKKTKTDIFCMSFERGFISTYDKISSWLGSVDLRYSSKFILNEYIKARKFMFSYIEDHRSAIQ